VPAATIKLNQQDQTFAITGGTGTYRNARGTVHIHAISDTESVDTINIIPNPVGALRQHSRSRGTPELTPLRRFRCRGQPRGRACT
jgi:hypothetical protein